MRGKTKKKKGAWQKHIATAFMMLLGGACGLLMVWYADTSLPAGAPLGELLFSLAALLLIMYAALFLQMAIHEAGHLVFGLLTGYGFSSFRLMSFMWVKEEGKLRFRRFRLAGTGGQCLMTPPEPGEDGRFPVALYNLGGPLMNVLAGLLFLGLSLWLPSPPLLSAALLMLALAGFALALMNGVPLHMGTVDNDGCNALSLRRSPEALRAFWVQMKVNEQTARGLRLKDMPEEWFAVPSDEGMKNSMTAVLGVFACNRLMDAHRFAEADALTAHLLEIDSAVIGLHRALLTCDRMYCELIGENRREVLGDMCGKEQRKLMRSMKTSLSVLRTEYACALLSERDEKKAAGFLSRFEKCARSYPYPSDLLSERELLAIARERAEAAGGREQAKAPVPAETPAPLP
ncbi:MAG: M50 family metallopeptidase [Oscillospiraceae bacterium]